jgi:uncharacterized protein DUF3145
MADYTQFTLTVFACPEDKRAGVLAAIHERDLQLEWDTRRDEGDKLLLGIAYTDTEFRVGDDAGLAQELVDLGATFECWEDPKYEWLGSYHAHVPGLGLFSGECDADGNVVVSAQDLRELINQAVDEAGLPDVLRVAADVKGEIVNAEGNVEMSAESLQDLIAAAGALERLQVEVDRQTGTAWTDALRPLREAAQAGQEVARLAEQAARDLVEGGSLYHCTACGKDVPFDQTAHYTAADDLFHDGDEGPCGPVRARRIPGQTEGGS